jgi:hypothetical protein
MVVLKKFLNILFSFNGNRYVYSQATNNSNFPISEFSHFEIATLFTSQTLHRIRQRRFKTLKRDENKRRYKNQSAGK